MICLEELILSLFGLMLLVLVYFFGRCYKVVFDIYIRVFKVIDLLVSNLKHLKVNTRCINQSICPLQLRSNPSSILLRKQIQFLSTLTLTFTSNVTNKNIRWE